ncbi:MAG: tRNA (adenosine(37)-N6)-threonylcarbamoyltransferase complex ATPase subunit type 1 TsaE [Vallitalea sp.]|nr:tRNA (adenosine(37)-N6)-threonylcarbamoyltransferase complex ATPase subunit type 1 TsaE [Vallitalea sp.]
MIYESYSSEDTRKIGNMIGEKAKKGQIYCLIGDLGVGKTVFTKGFAQGLGISEHITSPTFMIVNEYHSGRLVFNHFDVYRIEDSDEMYEIGYEEYFYDEGVCLVEWANLIDELIPDGAIWIKIEKDLEKGLDYRKISVE